jgi:hypothetical protein
MTPPIMIRKASGDLEAFNPDKLVQSLLAAGADQQMADEILADISSWLVDGVSTREIYARALSTLGHRMKAAAGRYRMKDALMQLGNSGRPFEVFTGEIFKARGYAVKVGIVVQGRSITHEMDVIATGKGRQHLVECKFSQMRGSHVSIQVPLYVHSRVNDIVALRRGLPEYRSLVFTGWVVTNTRFSTDSVAYARTYGLELLSWDYPYGDGIKDIIERERLYPITVLSSLSLRDKETYIAKDLVTCSQLVHAISSDDPSVAALAAKKRGAVLRELASLGIEPPRREPALHEHTPSGV